MNGLAGHTHSPGEAPAVEAIDVWRVYRAGARQVAALRGVNLAAPTGHFIALRGRSGSGKTTLLNCLGGLDRPTQGSVRVLGLALASLSDEALAHWRREQVGLVFQSFALLPTLSAYENVELMLRICGRSGHERHTRALECLELVGLSRWRRHRPYELSGGQQQRLAIARALANRPRLILADEPTGELDSSTSREILALFRRIVRESSVTLLMASHDPLADEYVDQSVQLLDGKVRRELPQ